MAMKAYACQRCLTMSSDCGDGDGGAHTCTPTPLVRNLEACIFELLEALKLGRQIGDQCSRGYLGKFHAAADAAIAKAEALGITR